MKQDGEQDAYAASLWQKYKYDRNTETRNELAEHYLFLVKLVAGRIAIGLPSHVDRDDLVSSGFFGLMDAIERYDPERKNKFETYAAVRIRGAMLDYLRSKDWVPVTIRQKMRRYEQAVIELEGELQRPATDEELCEKLGLNMEELHLLMGQISAATLAPLDDYLRVDTPELAQGSPAESYEKKELSGVLAKAIDRLPEKERLVVSLYYYEELTLKEIGLIMDLTEARISQLHTKAVFRLRGHLARQKASLF